MSDNDGTITLTNIAVPPSDFASKAARRELTQMLANRPAYYDAIEAGDTHPQVRVVEVDGPFRLDDQGEIICLNCEDRPEDEKS